MRKLNVVRQFSMPVDTVKCYQTRYPPLPTDRVGFSVSIHASIAPYDTASLIRFDPRPDFLYTMDILLCIEPSILTIGYTEKCTHNVDFPVHPFSFLQHVHPLTGKAKFPLGALFSQAVDHGRKWANPWGDRGLSRKVPESTGCSELSSGRPDDIFLWRRSHACQERSEEQVDKWGQ